MEIKFHNMFSKHWFGFPLCIEWESNLLVYVPYAARLSLHFLWWHFAWDFIKGGK